MERRVKQAAPRCPGSAFNRRLLIQLPIRRQFCIATLDSAGLVKRVHELDVFIG
jgi:hypothetical protein